MTERRTTPDADALLDALRAEEGSPERASGTGRLGSPSAPRGRSSRRTHTSAWARTWRWVVAGALVGLLGYLTYTRDGWVPLLSGVDFGIHEFGHLLFGWAPNALVWFAGSFVQVAVPLGLAVYFFLRRDWFASILTLAWSAESLNNVSVYIYDATRLQLALWGDLDGSAAGHDWANILTALRLIPRTDAIAYGVRGLSALLFAVALGLAVWGFARPRLERHHEVELAERRATLPVREPRNRSPLD